LAQAFFPSEKKTFGSEPETVLDQTTLPRGIGMAMLAHALLSCLCSLTISQATSSLLPQSPGAASEAECADEAALLQSGLLSVRQIANISTQVSGGSAAFAKSSMEIEVEVDENGKCPPGTETAVSQRWLGTAPWCSAGPGDCADIGYTYNRSSKSGGGSDCHFGTKVLCEKLTCKRSDELNPECNSQFNVQILGTAPFCDVDACDCLKHQSLPFRVEGGHALPNPCVDQARWFENGGSMTKPCLTGAHIVCLTPMADILSGSRNAMLRDMIASERTRCESGEKMKQERSLAITKAITEVASAATEVVKKAATGGVA